MHTLSLAWRLALLLIFLIWGGCSRDGAMTMPGDDDPQELSSQKLFSSIQSISSKKGESSSSAKIDDSDEGENEELESSSTTEKSSTKEKSSVVVSSQKETSSNSGEETENRCADVPRWSEADLENYQVAGFLVSEAGNLYSCRAGKEIWCGSADYHPTSMFGADAWENLGSCWVEVEKSSQKESSSSQKKQ